MNLTRILIIEDEIPLLEEIADWLYFEGYEVKTAKNGRQGLELAVDWEPDLILSDIMMPLMDGKQLLKALREQDLNFSTPFLFMSALSDKDDIREGMNMGADDYITKPFTRKDLLNAISTRLLKHLHQKEIAQKSISELRDRIINQLSKELLLPINTIISHGSLLDELPENIEKDFLKEIGQEIIHSANKLSSLAENLMIYRKLQLGFFVAENQLPAENLEAIIYEELFSIAAQYQKTEHFSLTIEPAIIKIDEAILRKIIRELAHKFFELSPIGANIIIEGKKNLHQYQLYFKCKYEVISQSDVKSLKDLMEFNNNSNGNYGVQLSINIVKQLIELSGGSIDIDTNTDGGTLINCTFPYFES